MAPLTVVLVKNADDPRSRLRTRTREHHASQFTAAARTSGAYPALATRLVLSGENWSSAPEGGGDSGLLAFLGAVFGERAGLLFRKAVAAGKEAKRSARKTVDMWT